MGERGILVLTHYTIYRGASDRPGPYTVRAWWIGTGSEPTPAAEAADFPTLEAARASIPVGLHRLDRHPDDDPVIVEVWI